MKIHFIFLLKIKGLLLKKNIEGLLKTMSGNLSFETFSSTVDLVFWRTFSEKKLEIFKLSDKPVNILGHYTCGSPFENTGSSLNLDGEAFSEKLTFDSTLFIFLTFFVYQLIFR